jgi:predicted RNase H-like HicB family nuclease
MSNAAYTVHAHWDEESKSWWTDGEDIPGLCCQADSFDELVEMILALVPDLLRENGIGAPGQSVDIAVTAERHGTARFAA